MDLVSINQTIKKRLLRARIAPTLVDSSDEMGFEMFGLCVDSYSDPPFHFLVNSGRRLAGGRMGLDGGYRHAVRLRRGIPHLHLRELHHFLPRPLHNHHLRLRGHPKPSPPGPRLRPRLHHRRVLRLHHRHGGPQSHRGTLRGAPRERQAPHPALWGHDHLPLRLAPSP